MNELYSFPGCRIAAVTRPDAASLRIIAERGSCGARCPSCGRLSLAVHSRYNRRPADLPVLGRAVRLELAIRRFYCHNPSCPRRTFAERLPSLLAPYARRTLRSAASLGRIAVALGGEAGARMAGHLGMAASGDTMLRLVRLLPLPRHPTPRVLGVDDWAIRKGRTYGTVLVDLERRRVVDLLPDRSAATLAGWLRRRRGIQVVARDRSSQYARGIALGAPRAVQVADRWHLLSNARQMLERWLATIHGRLGRLPPLPAGGAQSGKRLQAFPRGSAERDLSIVSRTRRIRLYDEVRRRHGAGEPLLVISRHMGLARGTVRKFARAESFPERAARAPAPSILDPYLAHLEARLAAGCENAMRLWRELRDLGFSGTQKQVHRWLSLRRTVPARSTPHCRRDPQIPASRPGGRQAGPALPSPRQLAWLLVQPPHVLAAADQATVARVKQDPEVSAVVTLVGRFVDLIRGSSVGRKARAPRATFRKWLAEATTSKVSAIATFAAGLKQDGAAVRAALTMPWSSGQAEGQITKLKLLKRQTYGRASFNLLRRRTLLAT